MLIKDRFVLIIQLYCQTTEHALFNWKHFSFRLNFICNKIVMP